MTERISLDGIPLELVDTAGLRDAEEEVEQLGIARSREALADADWYWSCWTRPRS